MTALSPMAKEILARYSSSKAKALVELIDCAYEIVEVWNVADSPYNKAWKAAWLAKARELGAEPSW